MMEKETIITLWERQDNNSKKWSYNHYSTGFNPEQTHPVPKGAIQERSWPKEEWRGIKAILRGNVVIEDQ